MTGFKTPLHGRTHLPMGSDPIPGVIVDAIRFNTDNVGGWLDITTNSADGDGHGIHLTASDDILIEGASVTVDATDAAGPLALHSAYTAGLEAEKNLVIEGGIDAGTTGIGVLVQATHGVLDLVATNGQVVLQASGGNTLWLQGQTVSLGGNGSVANGVIVNVFLKASENLIVFDHSGNQIFRIDEADGSVHIKTGTTVVANL